MLDVRVLGDLDVEFDGARVALPRSTRACALLGWLALYPGLHPRSKLAALFWPDVLDSSARASLRSAIWALRAALSGPFVMSDRERVGLAREGVRVDVREFARLLAEDRVDEAVGLCRGQLLYRFDEDWVFAAREEHDARLAGALRTLARRAERGGDLPAAIGWARRRVALRPLDEDAGRDLMTLHVAAGESSAALEAYERLRQRLRDELDIAPAPATERIVRALRTATPAESTRPARDRPSGLVGRDRELSRLAAAWRGAVSGRGQVAVLSGEGGIGKTRLIEEIATAARRSGGLTALGVVDRLAAGALFGPWTEVVLEVIAQARPPPLTLAQELGRVVPAAVPRDEAPAPAGDPKLDRIRFFEALVDLLAWACRDRPVLVAVEDLHLADASSLELVAHVGRRIPRLPVLLVLTRRRLPPRRDLDAVLAALRSRGALELDLGPLTAESVRELALATARLRDAQVEQIVALAGGSPLIATETSRAYARGDPASGLRDAVRSALGRLPARAVRFVEMAAVAGRDLGRGEIPALGVLSDPTRAATEALGADLLRVHDTAIGFRHALLREAVYDEIPDPLRARLHEAFAEALRSRPGRGRAAEIARHFRLAGRDDLAVGQLARAASDARQVAALAEAARCLGEALAIAPEDSDLLLELAEVQAWRGDPKESETAFARCLETIAPADGGALTNAWLRRARWMRGALCYPSECLRSYRNVLDVLDREPAADPLARAEALAGMAWSESVAGDPRAVEDLLREVGVLIGQQPPGDLLAHDVGMARGFARIREGRFTDSYGPLIAAAAAAGRAGRPDMTYGCLSNVAGAAACAGDFERALDFAERCAAVVTPNGLIQPAVYIHTGRAALLRHLARLPEARAACDVAAGLADRVGTGDLEGLVHHERGLIALASGDPAAAAAELQQALDLDAPVSRPLTRLLRAEALVRAGRPSDAEAELRLVALEPVSPTDFPDTLVARMNFVQGLVALDRGQHERAERHLQHAADGWQRRIDVGELGQTYVAAFADLGRPPVSSLVEPAQELARVKAELGRSRSW